MADGSGWENDMEKEENTYRVRNWHRSLKILGDRC